ncbi:isoprenoid synthase domain-containing protein [Phlebopus sp. FC_14]|nr:isoprenoid synthase domain-containing protein [Phlebopus sp. FC_14]
MDEPINPRSPDTFWIAVADARFSTLDILLSTRTPAPVLLFPETSPRLIKHGAHDQDISSVEVENIRRTIQALLMRCGVPSHATPMNQEFYQQCVDEAIRRGYPMDGHRSVRTYLREGAVYSATALAHLDHQPTRIWAALFTSCGLFVDDAASRASEVGYVYQFNDRFIQKEAQHNGVLDALADLLRETSVHFLPIPANLVTTSILNFVTASLLAYETKDMDVLIDAERYPAYARVKSGIGEAYAFLVFSRKMALSGYVQAIPEMIQFLHNMNDILSFYKEEKAGETTNQISLIASRNKTSKFEAFEALAQVTAEQFVQISKILEASPAACNAFKRFVAGYVVFHCSVERYKLADLQLC